jgi:hypothetical protein
MIRRLKRRFYARTYLSARGHVRPEWWGYRGVPRARKWSDVR